MSFTLLKLLHQTGILKYGEFTLKSGQKSNLYVDLRNIISYPTILKAVASTIWSSVQHCSFDLICGVPYTALPIATCISIEHNIPMVMRRKEKKSYGTKKMIEGVFKPGQTCLIIEDVITTGSSILETVRDLNEAGLLVHDAGVLIDREQGGKENLKKEKILAHSCFSLSEIIRIQDTVI